MSQIDSHTFNVDMHYLFYFTSGMIWSGNKRHYWTVNFIHHSDVKMSTMASQITCVTIVYSTVCSGADQRKRQSSASLASARGIYRMPVNSPHKWPVTRKIFPFDDVIMERIFLISPIHKDDATPIPVARRNKYCNRLYTISSATGPLSPGYEGIATVNNTYNVWWSNQEPSNCTLGSVKTAFRQWKTKKITIWKSNWPRNDMMKTYDMWI